MKLPDLLPPNDLLKKVEGVESGLHQRQRLGAVGVVMAVLQIVVLIVNNEWFEGLTTTNWMQLIKQRWGLLLVLIGVVASIVLATWSKFWIEESQAPFRYTYSIADFKPVVGEKAEGPQEERLSVQMSHDLAQRLNERIKRLSLLEEELSKDDGKSEYEPGTKRKSHIHIRGYYVIRQKADGQWFIEVMPRVRIGPTGSAETLAHVVRFKLPEESALSAKERASKDGPQIAPPPPQLTARQYEQILERVYYSVATEIYKQIQLDVKRKIALLPNDYYRAVALFHEAEDYAASNTLDAYSEALAVYDEAIKAFDPSLRRSLKSKLPRLIQEAYQRIHRGLLRLRRTMANWMPRFGKVELMCARAEIGYATMLIYRSYLASILSQRANPAYEARPVAKRALDRLSRLPEDLPGLKDALFNANVTLSLAWNYILGSSVEGAACLNASLRLNPARAEADPKYLFASGDLRTISSEKLQLYQQAVELEPRFDVAQFLKAYRMEMDWRSKPTLERSVAELVFREYEELLKTTPGNVGAWSNIGYMRWLLDDGEGARESFEVGREYKEIKRETFVAELDYGLARVAAEAGDFALAYQYFDSRLSALIAQGVAYGGRGETTEFYHYDLITESIIRRFDLYKQRVEANLQAWDELEARHNTFEELVTAVGDQTKRGPAIKDLARLCSLVARRTTPSDRRLLKAWVEKQTGDGIKELFGNGDLEFFSRQIQTRPSGKWDESFCADLQRVLLDRPFANFIDKYSPKKRIRDAVFAYVLDDYGNACYKHYLRSGDKTYEDLARSIYVDAILHNDSYVMAHFHLYKLLRDRGEYYREHIQKVIELEPNWPDGKLAMIMTLIDSLNNTRQDAASRSEDAQAKRKEAESKRDQAQSLDKEIAAAETEAVVKTANPSDRLGTEERRVGDAVVPVRESSPVPGNIPQIKGSARIDRDAAIKTLERETPSEELKKQADIAERKKLAHLRELKRQSRDLQSQVKQLESHATALENKFRTLETETIKQLETEAINEIKKNLQTLLPHKWLWSDGSQDEVPFNWNVLQRRDYRTSLRWEREFNSLHVRVLLTWAQAREQLLSTKQKASAKATALEKKRTWELVDHIEEHFTPEDFDLLYLRRRLLESSRNSQEKAKLNTRIRDMIEGWAATDPYIVVRWWGPDEAFDDAARRKLYLEQAKRSDLSPHCNRLLGDRLASLGKTDPALAAEFSTIVPSLYAKALESTDPILLFDLADSFEELEDWNNGLTSLKRARDFDRQRPEPIHEPRDYHLRIGRALLVLGDEDAKSEFDAIGKIPGVDVGRWQSEIVSESQSQIKSIDSYRLLMSWLEDQWKKVSRKRDVDGYEDTFQAILDLAQDKYNVVNPNPAAASSRNWYSDVTLIAIEVDARVFLTGDPPSDSEFQGFLSTGAERIERDLGVPIPSARIRGSEEDYLTNSYIIMINEVPLVLGKVEPARKFCPGYKAVLPALQDGTEAFNPQSGEMDGAWLDASQVATVEKAGGVVWNHLEYAARHLEAVMRSDLMPFLGFQQCSELLEKWQISDDRESLRRQDLVKKCLPDGRAKICFMQLLQGLAKESVPLVDLQSILDVFQKQQPANERDVISLIEAARLRLKGELPANNASNATAQLFYLSTTFEAEVKRWLHDGDSGPFFAIPPEETQELLAAFREGVEDKKQATVVVVTCTEGIRPFVARLIELEFPRVLVMSSDELRTGLRGQPAETIEYVK